MNRRVLGVALAATLITSSLLFPAPTASAEEETPVLLAGYGEADATWHVGAGSGQYSGKTGPADFASSGGYDPHGHSIIQQDSHGVQSRLSFKAIVVDDGEDRIALVKSDNYLAMDALLRRVGQILDEEDSSITHADIFHMGSHNHYSPYYSTPSWGVWLFQDIFDIRAYEYQARQMAAAILDAEDNLFPASMGATTVEHNFFKGQVQRRTVADDGTPGGYPSDFGDFGLSVVRFDRTDSENPGTIGTLINWGMHPEGLDNDRLITAEWLAGVERYVGQATGGGVVIGQGDVGSAESGPAKPYHPDWPKGVPRQWDNAGHAQVERGAWLLSQDVIEAWEQIGSGTGLVPMSSDIDVEAGNAYVPGPLSHPYPSVSNCRTETTIEGDPGVPILGLPDCARGGLPQPVDDTWETLRGLGVPLPDHYDAPSFTGVQENLRLRLQAFKLGEVILMSCACEAQVDLVLNLESRTNEVEDDMYLGYDWTKRLICTQAKGEDGQEDPEGDWTCRRDPNDPAAPGSTFPNPLTFSNVAYERMLAQIYNDARGWDAPQNIVKANVEPTNPEEIWGNFTHEELPSELGYKLPIAFGNAGEYNGYTVSYREYMAYDEYRKALTPYGPHTADYMNTRLTKLAGELNGGPALPPEPHDAMAQADEARQVAFTTALGQLSSASYDAWRAALPDDAGEPGATTQPDDIARFDATEFSWRGGSNAVDNPLVKVQRQMNGVWTDFAGQLDEIQTMVKFPSGANGFANTYSGGQEWIWTANFEAFNAFPRGIGSTPAGEYRFVAEGVVRKDGEDVPYTVESDPFMVSAWDGLKVSDLTFGTDGSVSFTVDSNYPKSYSSSFPYVTTGHMKDEANRGELRSGDNKPWCDRCSFRPWATSGGAVTAQLTVVNAVGRHSKVPATCQFDGSTSISSCSARLPAQGQAFIASGDVVDSYGETNAQCYELDADGGETCPAAESDVDKDGFLDAEDNCRDVANPGQSDKDGDGLGDACDEDLDGDTVVNDSDNCPEQPNTDQADGDGDDIGDACDDDLEDGPQGDSDTDGVPNEEDNCPDEANTNQGDVDGDAQGDACDADSADGPLADPDADGRTNAEETAAGTDPQDACDPDNSGQNCDADGDEIVNATDNCDNTANPDQNDADADGTGDLCDETPSPTPTSVSSSPTPTSDASSPTPTSDLTSTPSGGGSGGGGSGGGGSGAGGGGSSPSGSTSPTPVPTQSAAGDERGTVGSSIAANKASVDYRKPVTLSGQAAGDRACAPTEVEILGRTFGTIEFVPVGTADVGADGMWSTTVRSARSTAYAARPVDNELCEGQLSATLDVLVRARVTATVRKRCDARHAINGRVAPAYPGTVVKLKDKRAGRWVTVDKAKLSIKSRFHFPRCTGTRVVWPKQDPRNETGRGPVLTSVTIS